MWFLNLVVVNIFVSFQNIMKITDGLFLSVSKRVAKDYPEIEHNDMIIDNW